VVVSGSIEDFKYMIVSFEFFIAIKVSFEKYIFPSAAFTQCSAFVSLQLFLLHEIPIMQKGIRTKN
jgi:hypothetical protein